MAGLNFEILIDDSFYNLVSVEDTDSNRKENVLSIINDFEDGKWRYSKFQNFIWDNISETSLSYKERMSLIENSHTILSTAAKSLRLTDKESDISKGSELAEIALYGLMKHHYNALPVVPKIFYKQNSQDNAKGADSVHIVIENNNFTIWYGEAKFYNSIEDARLNTIVDSVVNSLQTDKIKKENSIITNISDIDSLVENKILRDNIKKALAQEESIDKLKSKLHIPILLLHECFITQEETELTPSYKAKIIDYHKDRAKSYFDKQLLKINKIYKYSEITFHLILFPIPSKKVIIDGFIKNTEHYKQQ